MLAAMAQAAEKPVSALPRPSGAVRILLLDDDADLAGELRDQLAQPAWGELSFECVATLADALPRLEHGGFDVVVAGLDVSDPQGLDSLDRLVQAGACPVIVVADRESEPLREQAIAHGAYDLVGRSRSDRAGLERLLRLAAMQTRTEHSLRGSESRFRSLIDLSSDYYWEQDEQHRFSRIEGRKLGLLVSTSLGKARWESGLQLLDGTWDDHRALLAAHRPFDNLVMWRRLPDGKLRYISVSGEPMFDRDGRFTGYRGVGADISAQKREEQLLKLEHGVSLRLADASSAAAGLKATIRSICETEGWLGGRYWHGDDEAGVLRFREAWGAPGSEMEKYNEQSREVTFRAGTGFVGRVWQSGEALWIPDVTKDERALRKDAAPSLHRRGVFVFPVVAGTKTIGVLAFNCQDAREPEERLLQTVRVIGSHVGQFLQRQQAEQDLRVHLRYQETLARFGETALGRREPAELVGDAVQTVLEALRADVVAYVERGQDAGELNVRGLAGAADGSPRAALVRADGDTLDRVLEHGEFVAIHDASAVLPFEWARTLHAAALAPVHGDNRVLGALCVLSAAQDTFGIGETKFLVTAASVLSAGLRRLDSEGQLVRLAKFDSLTDLPNRALFSDRFSQMVVQARRHEKPLGVLFIDLDHFKQVNDTFGHAGGDELLKETARRLQSVVRAGDTVARISGDEFAVILGDLARPDDAALVAQKMIDCLSAPLQICGQEVFVTASIGIAAFPADGDDAEDLLGAADAAMYRAKQAGRNAYEFFTTELTQRTRARAQLGHELRRALEREEFALVYQPKIDLRSGLPCAAEALLRWHRPDGRIVSPVEFIPVLEETGLIVPVGEWVLRRACADLKAWQAPVPLAVNLSPRQFRQRDLDARILAIIEACGVEARLVELELTESQLMHDPNHAIRVVRALDEAGVCIAIDDFGTGYSSLSHLTRFAVSALKIDRSFVADVLDDAAAAAIVRTIIDMGHTLGFTVIAEGVETEGQAALLRGLGCDQAQGFLFARPMPLEELKAMVARVGR
jgi:diguanylate cyclase (GGDEF)-like protein